MYCSASVGIQCVLVIRESFTEKYGSRVFHSSPCGPLFLHMEPNQLSLITRTHCTGVPQKRPIARDVEGSPSLRRDLYEDVKEGCPPRTGVVRRRRRSIRYMRSCGRFGRNINELTMREIGGEGNVGQSFHTPRSWAS